MNFGFFDDEHREFVITDPRTPVKWINFIGTPAFGGFVDHAGGALISVGDPARNPITHYDLQLPDSDFKGETLYLRMHSRDGQLIFSPFFIPALIPMDHFECSVGQGYSRWRTEVDGLCCEVTVFIPADAPVEIRDICLVNLRSDTVEVDALPIVEFSHSGAAIDSDAASAVKPLRKNSAHALDDCTVMLQSSICQANRPVNYFAASRVACPIEPENSAFWDIKGLRSRQPPSGVEKNRPSRTGDNTAAFLLRLGALPAGESIRFATLLGQATDLQEAGPIIRHYAQPDVIDAALAGLARPWAGQWVELPISAARPV